MSRSASSDQVDDEEAEGEEELDNLDASDEPWEQDEEENEDDDEDLDWSGRRQNGSGTGRGNGKERLSDMEILGMHRQVCPFVSHFHSTS